MAKAVEKAGRKLIASNRKARFLYEILDSFEAGIACLHLAFDRHLHPPGDRTGSWSMIWKGE